MRQVVYVTGTRSDFGLMLPTLLRARASAELDLSVCVTGMHLLPQYGNTVSEIEAARLPIHSRVPVFLDGSTGAVMAQAIGREIVDMTDALTNCRPDIVMVLGDRGEMLAATIAAIHLNICVVHIHGGERSGTVDEPIRHAISKLAHFHFVATEAARVRLNRMGEREDRVFVTGAPGLDNLLDLAVESRSALCSEVGLDPRRPIALVVFHPVLQEAAQAGEQLDEVMHAVLASKVQALCLEPNADAGGAAIRVALHRYSEHRGIRIRTHLSRQKYVSWLAASDVMVGNSSSGIIEAATFNLPVVNVGSRQRLREQSGNVQDVPAERNAIAAAVQKAIALTERGPWTNIYGDGRAAERIVDLLSRIPLDANVLNKVNAY